MPSRRSLRWVFPVGLLLGAAVAVPGEAAAAEAPLPSLEGCRATLGTPTAVAGNGCLRMMCAQMGDACASYFCVDFTVDWNANPLGSYIFISWPTTWVIYGVGSDGVATGPGWYTFHARTTPSVLC